MNHEAVCRTAPATPGLLIILDKVVELVGGGSVINRAYPVYFFLLFQKYIANRLQFRRNIEPFRKESIYSKNATGT